MTPEQLFEQDHQELARQQAVMVALNHPHPLFVADQVIKLDVTSAMSSVTLSNTSPNGAKLAIATVTMSTELLIDMAQQILAEAARRKDELSAQLHAFQARIDKLG